MRCVADGWRCDVLRAAIRSGPGDSTRSPEADLDLIMEPRRIALAVVLMAVASHYIAKLLVKYPWITWIGLAIIVYVAVDMIWDGTHDVIRATPHWPWPSSLTAVVPR